jgi:hypothetical protein
MSGLVFGAAIFACGTAQAETWCRNGTMCSFSSYQQCASTVRVLGGQCTRERARYSEPRISARAASRYAQYSSSPLPVNLHPTRFSCSNL